MISLNQVRDLYLEYFKSQGHAVVPSASLLPDNDPSTLFTSAGMQPIIPYLMGGQHPSGRRLVNSQKCFRSQDVDEVGDNRHTTFFEMLGNWSLGDYFKKEQIGFVFDFLVNKVGLNPQNIYVTVFRGNKEFKIAKDEAAAEYWQNEFSKLGLPAPVVDMAEVNGLQDGRIFYYDETKNWWSRSGVPQNMPVGELGGPDSEIFWDFGAAKQIHENSPYQDKLCHVNCDCGRFMEIGNSVFMQYLKAESDFTPLPQKNIDFGGGLERICAAANDYQDIFKLDVFSQSINELEKLSGKKYGSESSVNKSYRVILDHLRAATFLIADGAVPSNKDQGYFTRRLIRRSVRYANIIGLDKIFTKNIIQAFVSAYAAVYPELSAKLEFIQTEVQVEEEKFLKTISKGLAQFNKIQPVAKQISGYEAFDLFTTHGFPLEMTEELAAEQGLTVDKTEFYNLLKTHQDNSRTASAGKFKGGLVEHSEATTKLHTATHLTLEALKRVLGGDIQQKGSNITPERLRFDFNYPDKLTSEQVSQVEKLVNEQIKLALPVSFSEMTVEEAKAQGATGVFEHKYGDKVKVYQVGDFSKEICGGPHVTNTSDMGTYRIIKEEASSAGVRRIKAVLE